jgi:asparagine synthase (glutamine-hydrolysing)
MFGIAGFTAVDATGIFDPRAIHSLIRDHMERRINAGYHLWGLLTLFLWMKRRSVQAQPLARRAPIAPARLLAIK